MNIKIRTARKEEAAILSEITISAKRYWDYPETWIKLWENDLEIKPEFIENNYVFVAVSKNTLVGFVAISLLNKDAELDHLWILPDHMNKGIGKQLFQKVINICMDKNIVKLKIVSDPNAKQFYEKMGALQIGFVDSKPAPRKLPLMAFYIKKANKAL